MPWTRSGSEVAAATFPNTAAGHREILGWARSVGTLSRIGIEGSGSYGYALARFLVQAGEIVVEVPARLTERERGRLRRPGKSDAGDALAIARVAAREKHLPAAGTDQVGYVSAFTDLTPASSAELTLRWPDHRTLTGPRLGRL